MSPRWIFVVPTVLWLTMIHGAGWAAEDWAAAEQAVAKIASYKFGESREGLSAVETLALREVKTPGDANRLAALLHPLLAKDATLDGKRFVCRQLAVLGSKDSVPPLARLLGDERLADMAPGYALETIEDPAAAQALLTALPASEKKTAIGIINSLGDRQESAAVAALVERSESGDAEIRAASIHALGQIGGEPSARALFKLKDSVPAELRTRVLEALLACADKFARQGQTTVAKAVYENSISERDPVLIRVAAAKGMAAVDDAQTLPLVFKYLSDPEPELQDVALNLVRKAPGAVATQAILQQFSKLKLSPTRAALLLRALADRGDRAVLPVVMSSLESSEADVRIAALYALGQVGGADVVQRLARAAATASAQEQDTARESLAVLRGDTVDAAIVALLQKQSTDSKVRAALAASLGQRRAVGAVEVLLQTARDSDPAVQQESVRALGNLAGQRDLPVLIQLLLQVKGDESIAAAQQSIVTTARRIAEPDRRLNDVLSTLSGPSAKDAQSAVRLLPVVGQIGGARAVSAVESALKVENGEVRQAAVRTLAAWSNSEALPALLTIAKSEKRDDSPELRLLALQGYIRLLGIAADRTPQQRLAAYEEAFRMASRLDEKRQVLAGLPRVRVPETLKFVLPLLSDPDLGEDAARATVMLSTVGRRSEISRDEARAAMRQVLAVTKNPATREAATAILESPERR